jgi:CheY-like chemotaxis protein
MTAIRSTSTHTSTVHSGLRVLLVDDHPSIRSIIVGILNALGISDVTTAERADVALNYLLNGHFDLLITDYEMPGKTGVELAQAVRKDARMATPTLNFKIPILMITGNVTKARLHEARDAGIDEILAKPFTVLAVADRLNAVLKKRREFVICDAYIGPCRRRITQTAYVGPLRRDSDLVKLPEFEVEHELLLVKQEANSLCRLGQTKTHLSAGESESALAMALSIAQRALRVGDPLLNRAGMSLANYIQLAAKSNQVEVLVVKTHGQSFLELLELGTREPQISREVTQALGDLVTRRTSQKRAA